MPQFAANLSMMYTELPFMQRFTAAAQDGFKAVEYLFPYAFSKQELAQELKTHGLQQVLFNAPPGGVETASIGHAWDVAGDRGTAAVPGREDEFKAGVHLALTYAEALDCQIVEGDVASKIRKYLPTGAVGHFQIAGVPERHEPDVGELNYPYLFGVIDEVASACGWQGWVGCEYRPLKGGQAGGTSAGLGWLRTMASLDHYQDRRHDQK
jgi:hydroxypyruvate isomerase